MNLTPPYRRCPYCSSREISQHADRPRRRCRACAREWVISSEPTIRLLAGLDQEARVAERAHPTDVAVDAAADPTADPAEWVRLN